MALATEVAQVAGYRRLLAEAPPTAQALVALALVRVVLVRRRVLLKLLLLLVLLLLVLLLRLPIQRPGLACKTVTQKETSSVRSVLLLSQYSYFFCLFV